MFNASGVDLTGAGVTADPGNPLPGCGPGGPGGAGGAGGLGGLGGAGGVGGNGGAGGAPGAGPLGGRRGDPTWVVTSGGGLPGAGGFSGATVLTFFFSNLFSFGWTGNPAAVEYNVYRGPLHLLGPSYSGNCFARTTNTSATDSQSPSRGTGFFYLVTMDVACGSSGIVEGPMGDATSGPRVNSDPCP